MLAYYYVMCVWVKRGERGFLFLDFYKVSHRSLSEKSMLSTRAARVWREAIIRRELFFTTRGRSGVVFSLSLSAFKMPGFIKKSDGETLSVHFPLQSKGAGRYVQKRERKNYYWSRSLY
jgi:hypothetical protein